MAPNGLLALVATVLTTAAALNVTVPSKVSAGVETQIEIGFDFWKQPFVYETVPGTYFDEKAAVCRNPVDPEVGCGHDMLYEHYQLYLYTEKWMYTCESAIILIISLSSPLVARLPPTTLGSVADWKNATGYLSDLIPVGTTNPKITIPKDLGPAESYQIAIMEFNGTKPQTNYYGVELSNRFALADTDIDEWTAWEDLGGWLKPWYSLPCSSYGCYRACGLKFADEHGNKKQGTAAGLYNCLNECPGIRADWDDQFSPWAWYKAFDEHDWSGESTAVLTSTPSAVSTSGWPNEPYDTPETTLYGTPTAGPTYARNTASAASPTATTQTSAGRRRARPPSASVPVSYVGGLLMTLAICLVAFGIGTVLGWIWPDGLRSEW
ncbi:hypothetical protein EsH8_IV_001339 [Colletotrichum jinshuiense]